MAAFQLSTRRLVVVLERPGRQWLFHATLKVRTEANDPIEKIQLHILENLHRDLTLAKLAEIVGMSPRHLSRLFREELDMSLAAYVEMRRVDKARHLLEHGASPLKTIAYRVGFGSTATLRRAFRRRLGMPPAEYRHRFQWGGAAPDTDRGCPR